MLESIDAEIADPVAVKNELNPGTMVKPYEPDTLITKLPDGPFVITESANTFVVESTYVTGCVGCNTCVTTCVDPDFAITANAPFFKP